LIELQMVRRMTTKGAILAPVVVLILGLIGGTEWAFSAAVGFVMTLGNLWLAARIIGTIAEHNPKLLLAAAMTAFMVGLFVLTLVALALRALEFVYFPITGFTLIGSHLVLVLWEAAGAYSKVEPSPNQPARS
jgi:hypothetical protein